MKKHILIVVLFILSFSNNSSGQDTLITLNNIKRDIHLIQFTSVLIDTRKNLTIDSVLAKKKLFTKDSVLAFGMTKSKYWIRFTLKNTSNKKLRPILSIANPDLNEIELFIIDKNKKTVKHTVTGENYIFSSREFFNRNYIFELPIDSCQTNECFVSIYNNDDAIFVPLRLNYDFASFDEKDNNLLLLDTLFYGLLCFIIIFNILVFLTLRDIIFLSYSCYVICVIMLFLVIDGYAFQYLWPINPWFSNRSFLPFPALSGIFQIIFFQLFLKLKQEQKFIYNIFYFFSIPIISVIIMSFLSFSLFIIAVYALFIILVALLIFMIILLIIYLKKRYVPSYYLLTAFSITLVGGIVYFFKIFGIFNGSFIENYILKIGISLETIILAFAVIDRFNREQKEGQSILIKQKELIDNKNSLLEDANKRMKLLSTVASKTDNLVIVFDRNKQLEWSNEATYNFSEKHFNRFIQRLTSLHDNDSLVDFFILCITNKEAVHFELETTIKTDQSSWFMITLTPILGAKEEINKVIAICSDITQIKKIETELIEAKNKAVESDNLKTSFLSNISHEIRTPLNVIFGFTDMLNDSKLKNEIRLEYISYIQNSVKNLSVLFNNILDLSKIESRQLPIFFKEINIHQLLNELHSKYSNLLILNNKEHIQLTLKKELTDPNVYLFTDGNRLMQIFSNLLDNAFKYTTNGTIEFGYKIKNDPFFKQQPLIEFYVKDTGRGIEKTERENIFERFRKIEKNKNKLYQGTGLGLSIAKNLVEMLNGKIYLDSEQGKGSIFHFVLPFIKTNEYETLNSNSSTLSFTHDWHDKTILIAEDEEFNFKYLTLLFEKTNAKILHAKTGQEVIDICKNIEKIDLILMDIKMPEINGRDAALEIKKFNKDIPIIAQTAYDYWDIENSKLENGIDDYISKPILSEELLNVLVKYLK